MNAKNIFKALPYFLHQHFMKDMKLLEPGRETNRTLDQSAVISEGTEGVRRNAQCLEDGKGAK